MTRKSTPEIINSFKTAFKRVISDVGGQEAAVSCTRVGKSQISDYGSVDSEKMPPVDVVFDLEMIGGKPHCTSALAAAQGFELLPLETRPTHKLVECLQRISEDNGAMFASAVKLLGGGVPAERDKVVLLRDLDDVIAAAREARLALRDL